MIISCLLASLMNKLTGGFCLQDAYEAAMAAEIPSIRPTSIYRRPTYRKT